MDKYIISCDGDTTGGFDTLNAAVEACSESINSCCSPGDEYIIYKAVTKIKPEITVSISDMGDL